MASISSLSSASSSSSIYGNRTYNIISGLASGLDTEELISGAVQGYQQKIQNLQSQTTKLQWQQEAYQSISDKLVEFAVKLPGRAEGDESVYLPIDAKFPKDVYEQLLDAYESGDLQRVETTSRILEQTIRGMAKDIRDKYLAPPHTTDFGIMFLPFESIYGEVTRRAALLEQLQQEYHVIVTGPTTLAAILNSLQMGFRTLAIQKRSSEVWRILGGVKAEFEKFGGLLEKAQKNLQTANNQLEEVMGKRTRAIQRQLRSVEALPAKEEQNALLDSFSEGDET